VPKTIVATEKWLDFFSFELNFETEKQYQVCEANFEPEWINWSGDRKTIFPGAFPSLDTTVSYRFECFEYEEDPETLKNKRISGDPPAKSLALASELNCWGTFAGGRRLFPSLGTHSIARRKFVGQSIAVW
jgi:hypothetical protein